MCTAGWRRRAPRFAFANNAHLLFSCTAYRHQAHAVAGRGRWLQPEQHWKRKSFFSDSRCASQPASRASPASGIRSERRTDRSTVKYDGERLLAETPTSASGASSSTSLVHLLLSLLLLLPLLLVLRLSASWHVLPDKNCARQGCCGLIAAYGRSTRWLRKRNNFSNFFAEKIPS